MRSPERDNDTLRELQSGRPETVQRAIPREVLEWEPETPVQIDRKMFMKSLKTAPKVPRQGQESAHTNICEYFWMKLPLWNCFWKQLPVWPTPRSRRRSRKARLTALSKPDGGVRGIATGCSLRRLVARTFAEEFVRECAPFQYALSTRAGTDCLGHMLRAACDADGSATVLRGDGIGAYDHVPRSAKLERLGRMPKARTILPFVRLSYASSSYSWWDENGEVHTVNQAEGGEQGHPLMPLLFSIGIQGALEEVAGTLEAGEQFCVFLDDVCVLCQPHRVMMIYDELARCRIRVAGIRLHQGKTRVWNKARVPPEGVHILGDEARLMEWSFWELPYQERTVC